MRESGEVGRAEAVGAWTVLVLVALIWGWHLDAGSPWDYDWSHSPRTDEAAYTLHARTSALAGEYGWNGRPWLWDESHVWPVAGWAASLSFELSRPGVLALRVPSVLFLLAACLALVLWMRKSQHSLGPAWLPALLVGLSFPAFVYLRLGNEFSLVIFLWIVAHLICSEARSGAAWVAAGVLAGVALRARTHVAPAFVGLGILAIFRDGGSSGRRIACLVLGALAGFGSIWLLHDWPGLSRPEVRLGRDELQLALLKKLWPSWLQGVRNLALSPGLTRFCQDMAGLILLAASGAWAVLRTRPRKDPLGWAFLASVTAVFLAVGILEYQPLRYRVYALPPLALLATRAWSRTTSEGAGGGLLLGCLFGLGVGWTLQGLGGGLPRAALMIVITGLGIACGLHARRATVPAWRQRAFLVLALLGFVAQEATWFASFHMHPNRAPIQVSAAADAAFQGARPRIVGARTPGTYLYDSRLPYFFTWTRLDAEKLHAMAREWNLTHYAILLRNGQAPPLELVSALGERRTFDIGTEETLAIYEIRR